MQRHQSRFFQLVPHVGQVCIALSVLSGIGAAQAKKAPALEKLMGDWVSLEELAESLRHEFDIPALALGFVEDGELVEFAVQGVRRADQEDEVEEEDRFHLGSVTKSITASMLARLVEEEVLQWTTTIGDVLPEMPMQAAYRSVTLEQLVQHRAGIREDLLLNPDLVNRMKEQGEDSTAQRAAYVEDVLGSPPIGEAGKESRYSNAGYAVAAYLGEVRTGESWEQLVRRTVFQPLEMATGSFGWPAKAQDPDAPYGHFGMPRQRRVQEFEDYDIGKFWRPAGDVACCLEDLARYAAGHIAGLRGEDGFLKAATVARLHTPLVDDPGGPYAAGWSVLTDRHGGTVHWHNGSAGTFLAEVLLFPDDNTALLFLSNAAGGIEPAIESLLLGSIADRLFRES